MQWIAAVGLLAFGVSSSQGQQSSPSAAENAPPANAMAFALGANLGLAAAVHEAGSAPQIVENKMATCEALAEALGGEIPPLPEREGKEQAAVSAEIMHYLVKDIEPLGRRIKEKHSPRDARLFEIGVKSSLLTFMYAPGDSTGLAVADLIEDRAKKCELPPELCQPLITAVREQKPYDEVKSKLFAMHEGMRKHLMAGK